MPMNPEIKSNWLKALRSGTYRQAHEELIESNGSLCCLGVLAAICSTNPEEFEKKRDPGCPGELNETFLFEVGLTKADQMELIQMNDDSILLEDDTHDYPNTFPIIADYIEKAL